MIGADRDPTPIGFFDCLYGVTVGTCSDLTPAPIHNLPFDEWTSVFGSERLTGALLDRLTHHVHILEMNGDSFRLAHARRRSRRTQSEPPSDADPQE